MLILLVVVGDKKLGGFRDYKFINVLIWWFVYHLFMKKNTFSKIEGFKRTV